jgi:hypothetical protein
MQELITGFAFVGMAVVPVLVATLSGRQASEPSETGVETRVSSNMQRVITMTHARVERARQQAALIPAKSAIRVQTSSTHRRLGLASR